MAEQSFPVQQTSCWRRNCAAANSVTICAETTATTYKDNASVWKPSCTRNRLFACNPSMRVLFKYVNSFLLSCTKTGLLDENSRDRSSNPCAAISLAEKCFQRRYTFPSDGHGLTPRFAIRSAWRRSSCSRFTSSIWETIHD